MNRKWTTPESIKLSGNQVFCNMSDELSKSQTSKHSYHDVVAGKFPVGMNFMNIKGGVYW